MLSRNLSPNFCPLEPSSIGSFAEPRRCFLGLPRRADNVSDLDLDPPYEWTWVIWNSFYSRVDYPLALTLRWREINMPHRAVVISHFYDAWSIQRQERRRARYQYFDSIHLRTVDIIFCYGSLSHIRWCSLHTGRIDNIESKIRIRYTIPIIIHVNKASAFWHAELKRMQIYQE